MRRGLIQSWLHHKIAHTLTLCVVLERNMVFECTRCQQGNVTYTIGIESKKGVISNTSLILPVINENLQMVSLITHTHTHTHVYTTPYCMCVKVETRVLQLLTLSSRKVKVYRSTEDMCMLHKAHVDQKRRINLLDGMERCSIKRSNSKRRMCQLQGKRKD